jgi:hypothetical protein
MAKAAYKVRLPSEKHALCLKASDILSRNPKVRTAKQIYLSSN